MNKKKEEEEEVKKTDLQIDSTSTTTTVTKKRVAITFLCFAIDYFTKLPNNNFINIITECEESDEQLHEEFKILV